MRKKKATVWHWTPRAMLILGGVMTVVTVLLRVLLLPLLHDGETGRFQTNYVAIAVAAVTVLALVYLARHTYRPRVDIAPDHSLFTAVAAIGAGAVLGIWTGYHAVQWLLDGIMPLPVQVRVTTLTLVLLYAMFAFGLLGAIGMIVWGFQVAAESGTRRGMASWWMLAPVMWAWFRLVWFEMAYSNSVGWTEKFFDFLMVIAQLLFLFKFARFASGIGKVTTGGMLAYGMVTVLFSLSGALTRVILYFYGGAQAHAASRLAGIADFAIGAFAFAFCWALSLACKRASLDAVVTEEELADDDTPYDPSLEPLLVLDDGDEGNSQP